MDPTLWPCRDELRLGDLSNPRQGIHIPNVTVGRSRNNVWIGD